MDDFHDYEIVGIASNRDQRLFEVTLLDPANNRQARIQLTGVLRANVDAYGLQNVVLDINSFTTYDASFEFYRACSLLGLDPLNAFVDGARFLTLLQASVGAEIALLSTSEPLKTD